MKPISSKGVVVLPALFLFLFLISACTSGDTPAFSEKMWTSQVAETRIEDLHLPHYREGKFFAPWMEMTDKSIFDLLRWKLFSKIDYTEEEKIFLPRVIPDTADRIRETRGDFILWIGHNTFLIRVGGVYWLTDPIFSKRALLPARLTPPALSVETFNDLFKHVNIVISHNHYDHLDRSSMKALAADSTVFVPRGLKSYVMGMNRTTVNEMDWWEEKKIGTHSRLICLPAQHWSLRINQKMNRSLWASYLLITPTTTFYFGGDSGYFKGFEEIGRQYPGIDYAFLATTAYQPRWFMHYQHMNIAEAIRGFKDLNARFFIPTQWGTFRLGDEPAGFPGLELARYIDTKQVLPAQFKIMNIGQILPIDPSEN